MMMVRMTSFAILLLCLSLISSINSQFQSEDQCEQAVTEQQQKLLKSSNNNSFSDFLVGAMNRGLWNCSKKIVQISSEAKQYDFRTVFDVQYRLILSELTSLKTTVDSYLSNPLVSPAFQWAQSTTEIMLSVKFSHKIDAPATLNVEATNVTILSDRLSLEATDGRKIFKLELDFFKDIIPDESRYEMASVGRMTFTFKKADGPSKWSRLLKQTDSKLTPSNMHKWFAMQEKHDVELSKIDVTNTTSTNSTTSTSESASTDVKSKAKKDKEKTVKNTKVATKKATSSSNDDDDDDNDKDDKSSSISLDHPNYERIETLKKSQAAELKAILDEAMSQKKSLDVKWREDKKRVDEMTSSKRKVIESRIQEEIDALVLQTGSIQQDGDSPSVGSGEL